MSRRQGLSGAADIAAVGDGALPRRDPFDDLPHLSTTSLVMQPDPRAIATPPGSHRQPLSRTTESVSDVDASAYVPMMSAATAAKGRLVMLAVAGIASLPVLVFFAMMLVSSVRDTISGWLQ